MNQETQHRNKCQNCFRNVGKFILDCYCFLCVDCFQKQRPGQGHCRVCGKPTSGKFIDTRDRNSLVKVNHLFSSFQTSLSRCLDTYRFQNDIDLRYCRYLEHELGRYKDLLSHIVNENPRLADFVNAFFKRKATPHRSVSQQLQGRERRESPHRSRSTSSVQEKHDRIVQPRHVRQGERNYSAKVGYKVPNINYSTALRSSKRPASSKDVQEEDVVYYRR